LGLRTANAAANDIARRGRETEREKPADNKDTKSAKLERLRSARLIYCDPKVMKLDMQRLQR
jgi:hypothetical protein